MLESKLLILTLKLVLISAGVLLLTVSAKSAVPLTYNFALNDLPAIYSVIVSWLEPPYLYFIVNGIIIAIVACTHFQHNHRPDNNQSQSHQQVDYNLSNLPPPVFNYDIDPSGMVVEPPVVCESKHTDVDVETVVVGGGGNEDEFNSPPPLKKVQPEFDFPVIEKQLIMSRFVRNRKPAKNIPEGARALRVLKPKKHETMDSTWKMITESSRSHFRKSDTFDNRPFDESTNAKVVRKSETFKDRTSYENQPPPSTNLSPTTSRKLKKDVSLGRDELNLRVEAFIKKFNDDMRLQREESLNRYI